VAHQLVLLERQLGLGRPIPVQYWFWVKPLLEGKFGNSDLSGRSVVSLIGGAAPPTLWLIGLSVLLSVPIAIGLGVVAARFRSSVLDRGVRFVSTLGLAVPPFWLGLLLLLGLAVDAAVLPANGYVSPATNFGSFITHMAMPVTTLTLYLVAVLTRFVYSEVTESLAADYVRTARAMGLSEMTVVFWNAARNALIPMVSILAASLGPLVGGAVLVEQVFSLGGLGELLLNSVLDRDYAVVQGIVIFLTIGIVVLQGVADAIYRRLDPRVR
jgi:peptide/nickel transport system permease protein